MLTSALQAKLNSFNQGKSWNLPMTWKPSHIKMSCLSGLNQCIPYMYQFMPLLVTSVFLKCIKPRAITQTRWPHVLKTSWGCVMGGVLNLGKISLNLWITNYFVSPIIDLGTCICWYLCKHRWVKSSLKRKSSHVTEHNASKYFVILSTQQRTWC